jgi:signal transduction histidine kinase
VPVLSLVVLYLLAIIPVAVAWGIVYAVGMAVGSMLAFNFFFLRPLYTLTLQDTRNWFALLVFLVTAIVVSQLATRSRRRAEEAEAALAALRELTEERERLAQEALEAEALRRSDAMKTALLRAVSHDLRSPLMAILRLAQAENATLVPAYLLLVPLRYAEDSPLREEVAVAMPLLEAVEHAALRAGVPVDARIEKGRSPTHALQRLWDEECFDRILAPAPVETNGGFSAKDVSWILAHSPAETIVLKPSPNGARHAA